MEIFGWIILFLIIFMLHNLEEIIMVEKWRKNTYPRVRHRIPKTIQKELDNYHITSVQFAVIVFVISIFASIAITIAVLTHQYYLFLGINFFFALNIFTHPLQSLYLRCYTPGVLTSLFLVIPYYSLFFYHFYNTDLFTLNSIIPAVIVMILAVPAFLISQKIGEKWKI